jgi:hypothetical protein
MIFLKLWAVGAAAWVGMAYWAFEFAGNPEFRAPPPADATFGPPLVVLVLMLALGWALGVVRLPR